MSAGRQWVQEARGGDPRPTVRERREPVDLDRVMEVAFVAGFLTTAAAYLGGAFYGAYLLGGWVGAFALPVFMLPPLVYTLVKWNQRKTDRAIRTDARHRQETGGSGGGYETFR